MGDACTAEDRSNRLPWLICRFIDPDAEILYVSHDEVLQVAEREGGHSFDAPGATFTHRDGRCTFEVLIEEFHLGDDPALARLATFVYEALYAWCRQEVAPSRDPVVFG
jgi:hypothetical protein